MRFSNLFTTLLPLFSLVHSSPYPPHPAYGLLARDTAPIYNASLPNITIFATGGTIAGSASSNTQTTGYQAGALGIQTLLDAVPSITNISNVFGVQVSNVASDNITPAILLNISRRASSAYPPSPSH